MFPKKYRRNLFAATFAGFTVGAMALFFSFYDPWLPAGAELIPDGGFSTAAATNGWTGWGLLARIVPDGGFNGTPGAVLTIVSNKQGLLRFAVTDIKGKEAFRVSLRAAASGVQPGRENWMVPRAVFFYRDADGKGIYNVRHTAFSAPKDRSWKKYAAVFPVHDRAAHAWLYLHNPGKAGTLQADDISILPVRPRPSSPWWKMFFGLLWFAAAGCSAAALRLWKRRLGGAICATVVLILLGVLLPGKILDNGIERTKLGIQTLHKKLSPPVVPAVSAAQPSAPKPVAPAKEERPPLFTGAEAMDHIHLAGHFTLFSLLALLTAFSWFSTRPSLRRAAAVFAGLTLFAGATEVLQFIAVDRVASLYDLRTDLIGMAMVILLVFGTLRLRPMTLKSENPSSSSS